MKKFRLRIYDGTGETLADRYFDGTSLPEFLEAAVTEDSPTLWIHDGTDYVRIHDYNFREVTPENVRAYLSERIIDGDDLLGSVSAPYAPATGQVLDSLAECRVWLWEQAENGENRNRTGPAKAMDKAIRKLKKAFCVRDCPHCGETQVIFSQGTTACISCGGFMDPCDTCGTCECGDCPHWDGTEGDREAAEVPAISEDLQILLYGILRN